MTMTPRPRTKLCPRCLGAGRIETKGWGHMCHLCWGKGRVPAPSPYIVPSPPIKVRPRSLHKGERGM
jgi:DnaJ-class molecular chaperone